MLIHTLPRLSRRLSAVVLATAALVACQTPPVGPAPATSAAASSPKLADGAVRALKERFPDLYPVGRSTGPLLPDEVDDIAVALSPVNETGTVMIAVLAPSGKDEYRVVDASVPIHPGCEKCSVSLDIAEHVLYVHVIRAEGAGFANFTYQFSAPDAQGALRLVAVTAYLPAPEEGSIPHSFSASVNLLTGRRTDVIEDAQNGVASHRERQSGVPLRPPVTFGTFAFTADALAVETRRLPPVAFDPSGSLPPVAVEPLRTRFPTMTVRSQAIGPLRGDGTRDVAVILAPNDIDARAGAVSDAVVAVLQGQADGSMKLGEVSGTFAHACATCDLQVEIARRVLTVRTLEVDAAGSRTYAYQFAYRGVKDAAAGTPPPLRLVNVRTEITARTENADRHHVVGNANLITGDRVDVLDDMVHGRRNRSEQKLHLPVRQPIALAAFAFDPAVLDAATGQGPGTAAASAPASTPAPAPTPEPSTAPDVSSKTD